VGTARTFSARGLPIRLDVELNGERLSSDPLADFGAPPGRVVHRRTGSVGPRGHADDQPATVSHALLDGLLELNVLKDGRPRRGLHARRMLPQHD
jgi:hypothetical protein